MLETKEEKLDLDKLLDKLPKDSENWRILKTLYPEQAKRNKTIFLHENLKRIKKIIERNKIKITKKDGFLDLDLDKYFKNKKDV